MMDISDGLSSDVTRLYEQSGNGFQIDAWRLRIPPDVRKLARQLGEDPLDWAFKSGEEYELLFTLPAHKQGAFARFLSRHRLASVHCIGVTLRKGDRVTVRRSADRTPQILPETGWEHHIGG
jgi:thiamine-monophosphate kinase